MTSLAEQLREPNKDIYLNHRENLLLQYFAVRHHRLNTFLTSLNVRMADELDWDTAKGLLIEEYMKR